MIHFTVDFIEHAPAASFASISSHAPTTFRTEQFFAFQILIQPFELQNLRVPLLPFASNMGDKQTQISIIKRFHYYICTYCIHWLLAWRRSRAWSRQLAHGPGVRILCHCVAHECVVFWWYHKKSGCRSEFLCLGGEGQSTEQSASLTT